MHNRIIIFGMTLPAYGVIAVFGMAIVTLLGIVTVWCRKLSVESFIKLEFVGGSAAIIGAKLWDMITNAIEIQGYGISLDSFMDSGLSFYGGLIIGACSVFLTSQMLHLDFGLYAKNLIYLVPLLHGIWKIGCFMGGCCYGIPYNGLGFVIYPEGVKAPAGIEIFPIQLFESGILFIMTAFFFVKGRRKEWKYPVLEYIGSYSGIRFCVEFFRWHNSKWSISIAQIISLVCMAAVMLCICMKERTRAKRIKNEQQVENSISVADWNSDCSIDRGYRYERLDS